MLKLYGQFPHTSSPLLCEQLSETEEVTLTLVAHYYVTIDELIISLMGMLC